MYLSTPEVAVIIATKNRPNLLKNRSLSSVLTQSKPPSYIIVVDDSSGDIRDENKSIVDSFPSKNCHVKYLLNHRTPGASGAWNTAVEYLSSELLLEADSLLLAFLDDDDEWHSNYLDSCLSVINEKHCNMVATGFYRYESNEHLPIECIPPNVLTEDLFLRGNPGIQGSNLFLSLQIMLMAGGFDEQLSSCTDRDLCIRLCELDETRYFSINKLLLNHYADNDRERLSLPNSLSKNKGLGVFWQKYYGRMNELQREAFLDRAHTLFNWQPEVTDHKTISKKTERIALTLGVELGEISFSQLNKTLKAIQDVDQTILVGFDIVLTANVDGNLHDVNAFIDLINGFGITCYNLCGQQVCVEAATLIVAQETLGYSPWVLCDKLTTKYLSGNDIHQILQRLDAHQLFYKDCNQAFLEEPKNIVDKIKQYRIEKVKDRIQSIILINEHDLRLLGLGSEAVVMSDNKRVFKYIDYWQLRIPTKQIEFLKWLRLQWHDLPGLYNIDEIISDGACALLTYPYEQSSPYQGGYSEQVVNLLFSCSKAGFVFNNMHPKNLVKTNREVKLIDYGSDIRPWNELGFEHMARRAYLSIYYANHQHLEQLMSQSLRSLDFPEMESYPAFRKKLIGIDCNLKQLEHVSLPMAAPSKACKSFALTIGVITGDPYKLLPLLNSIAELTSCDFLSNVSIIILCNGCTKSSLKEVLLLSNRSLGEVEIISESKQIEDSEQGLFGADFLKRPIGQVGIAHARSMLQKYVGLKCITNPDNYAWILDDDMRIDARAKQFLAWLPMFKQSGVDIVIGQYEGSSPNPPLNGLRGQLVDLLHNLRWLEQLPSYIELPDRSRENEIARNKYPDYYYDLSRKHTAHVEVPFWLEPSYKGETVMEARLRLFTNASLLVTGFPLTRSIIPKCSTSPLKNAKDTLNRGGNTFVLNANALIQAPNLIPIINGREARRSDMLWSIINKFKYGLTIKGAPFPVLHTGRVQHEKTLNLNKVQDEIMGAALYAGLQDFLQSNKQHDLIFSDDEVKHVWNATKTAYDIRLSRLRLSFYRINGLAQGLSKYPELSGLNKYLINSFNESTFTKLEDQVKQMNEQHICYFLNEIVPQSNRFAKAHLQNI